MPTQRPATAPLELRKPPEDDWLSPVDAVGWAGSYVVKTGEPTRVSHVLVLELEGLDVVCVEDAGDEGVACGARGTITKGDIDVYSDESVLSTVGQLAENVE